MCYYFTHIHYPWYNLYRNTPFMTKQYKCHTEKTLISMKFNHNAPVQSKIYTNTPKQTCIKAWFCKTYD